MEELLMRALSASGEPVAVIRRDGSVVFVSDPMGAYLKVDPLRARGMRCEELFGEDLCSLAMCAVRSASCPAFGVSSRDGRLECRIIPGEDGILGAVVRLNVRDRAFRRAMRDLAFQRRLTGLVEQDPGTLMLVLDGDGRVLRANGAAGDLFRGSPVGRYAWEMGPPPSGGHPQGGHLQGGRYGPPHLPDKGPGAPPGGPDKIHGLRGWGQDPGPLGARRDGADTGQG